MVAVIFALTIVFGPLRLLSQTKVFEGYLVGPFEMIFPTKVDTHNIERNFRFKIQQYLDVNVQNASLVYQVWFWFNYLSC